MGVQETYVKVATKLFKQEMEKYNSVLIARNQSFVWNFEFMWWERR